MVWADSRSHLVISIVLFVFDLILVIFSIVLFGWQSSATACSGILTFSVWSFIFPLVLLAPIIAAFSALIKRRRRLFSRIAFYSFFFLILVTVVTGAGISGRCVPDDSRTRIEMGWFRDSLKQYHDDKGSYPVSLDAVKVNGLPAVPDISYERTGTSYELCSLFKKQYFYGIPIDGGKRLCVDPQHPPNQLF